MDINHLLKDISIRHACKNVSKYLADVEKAVGIKLVLGCQKHEFTWSKDFEWYTDASDEKDRILYYFRRQQPKMLFTVKDYEISGHYKLSFRFTFHPENAV